MMMSPDELVAAADASGLNPLQYSHMVMGDQFLDEEWESRLFNPLYLRVPGLAPTVSNLTVYDAATGLTHTKHEVYGEPEPQADRRAIVVQVDGACKNNGDPNAAAEAAAIGVYFGPSSRHNFASRVPAHLPQTNQVAELYAVLQGLERIQEQFRVDFSVDHVYIVTDSRYVVEGLSEHVMGWRTNGYQNAKKKTVVNHEIIKRLDKLMLEMAEDELKAAFWSVGREENEGADKLAKGQL